MEARHVKMLEEVHEAVVGSTQSVGLQEQVRSLDARMTRVEGLVSKATTTLFEKLWVLLVGAASGWLGSHFPGTRP